MISHRRFPTVCQLDHLPDHDGGALAVRGCTETQRPPLGRTLNILANPSGGSRYEHTQADAHRHISKRSMRIPTASNAHTTPANGARFSPIRF